MPLFTVQNLDEEGKKKLFPINIIINNKQNTKKKKI